MNESSDMTPEAQEHAPPPCRYCGAEVEQDRRCCPTPTCHDCMPPGRADPGPTPAPQRTLAASPGTQAARRFEMKLPPRSPAEPCRPVLLPAGVSEAEALAVMGLTDEPKRDFVAEALAASRDASELQSASRPAPVPENAPPARTGGLGRFGDDADGGIGDIVWPCAPFAVDGCGTVHVSLLPGLDPSVASGFEALGAEIGRLVATKQAAYGNSFGRSGEVLLALYPNGIPPKQLDDALTVVRIVDKLFRIATDRDALGESPWRDIAGYALLALERSVSLTPVSLKEPSK